MERNSRKKSAKQCHGTSKCSTLQCQTCNRKTSSGTKISKYFTKPEPTELGNTAEMIEVPESIAVKNECLESPYKYSVKPINCKINDSVSDEKDFMSPELIKKKKTVIKKPAPKATKSKPQQRTKRATRRTCMFQQTIEGSFKNLDVNADHLQMALALSESTHEAENPESQQENSEEKYPPFTETPKKNPSLKSTLDQFGFRYGGVQGRTSTFSYHDAPKKRKKSKFAFVTPTLLMRTEEDREATITSKVSLILSEICREPSANKPKESIDIGSELLQKYNSQTRKFFKLASMDLSDLNNRDLFYTTSLSLPTETSKCGCLLKNWQDIPGRDQSPSRNQKSSSIEVDTELRINKTSAIEGDTTLVCTQKGQSSDMNAIQHEKDVESVLKQQLSIKAVGIEKSTRRSISPDLFCDDEDNLFESNENDKLTPSSNKESFRKFSLEEFEDNNGICHFESFNEDAVKLSQEKIKHLSQRRDIKYYSKDTKQTSINPSDVCDLTVSSDDEVDDTGKAVQSKGHKSELAIQEETVNKREANVKLCESQTKISTEDVAMNDGEIVQEKQLNSRAMSINSSPTSVTEIDNIEESHEDEIMNEDTIILENSFSNIQSPGPSSNKNVEEVETTSNRFSVGFDFNFSNESSLNVTRYINSMLNKSLNITNESSVKELASVEDAALNCLHDSTVNEKNDKQVNSSPKHLNTETDELAVFSSQASSQEVQYISDEELDYSSNFKFLSKRKSKVKKKLEYQDNYIANSNTEPAKDVIVLSDDSSDSEHNKKHKLEDQNLGNNFLNDSVDDVLGNLNTTLITNHISNIVGSAKCSEETPKKSTYPQDTSVATPKNTLTIKTNNVTPMPCYDSMDTPKVLKELDKFGLKPLKRQRGVQLLKYIYESTHPVVGPQEDGDCSEEESEHRKCKKRKKIENQSKEIEETNTLGVISENYASIENMEIVGDIIPFRENECNLIFERRQSSKIASCRIPLDIVWHNFISSNKQLRENMLLYEPLQLEVVHSMLKDIGFKFHIQDLLTFLDRKCITVRVAGNQGHAKRK